MTNLSLKISGYITIGLTSVKPVSFADFKDSVEQNDSDKTISFYSENLERLHSFGQNPFWRLPKTTTDNSFLEKKYSNRFLRLNKVSHNYDHYIIKSTNHSIKEI